MFCHKMLGFYISMEQGDQYRALNTKQMISKGLVLLYDMSLIQEESWDKLMQFDIYETTEEKYKLFKYSSMYA